MIKIIDNVISADEQDRIESIIKNKDFPLFMQYYGTINYEKHPTVKKFIDNNIKDNPQLTHTFVYHTKIVSQHAYEVVNPFKEAIEKDLGYEVNVLRAKVNINIPSNKLTRENYYYPHVDITPAENCITAIYYVSDTDGDTFFFDENLDHTLTVSAKVSPKKGRLVYFDTKTIHAGQSPFNYDTRIVLNLNFIRADS